MTIYAILRRLDSGLRTSWMGESIGHEPYPLSQFRFYVAWTEGPYFHAEVGELTCYGMAGLAL